MKKYAICVLCIMLCAACAKHDPQFYRERDATVCHATVNGHIMILEVSDDPGERAMGLKFRKGLGVNSGMIFVYPESQVLNFWMKDTFIELAIAFLDEEGTILNIQRMFPHELQAISSQVPAMYAIEMRSGWFTSRTIQAGDTIDIASIKQP